MSYKSTINKPQTTRRRRHGLQTPAKTPADKNRESKDHFPERKPHKGVGSLFILCADYSV